MVAGLVVLEFTGTSMGLSDDEGINLLKAFMVERGHPLYEQVYSDQAPAYTWLLALVIRMVGPHYGVFQQVSLLFGVLLLGAAAAISSELGGRWAGILCAALLLAWAP